jgi:hypothetical protein
MPESCINQTLDKVTVLEIFVYLTYRNSTQINIRLSCFRIFLIILYICILFCIMYHMYILSIFVKIINNICLH